MLELALVLIAVLLNQTDVIVASCVQLQVTINESDLMFNDVGNCALCFFLVLVVISDNNSVANLIAM